MKRTAHLTDALVLELVTVSEFELPPAAVEHLNTCARCEADVRELRELVAHVRDHGAEPPTALLGHVLALMPPEAPKPHRSRQFPLAQLVFDSHAAHAETGMRSAISVRQLAWRSEGLAIDAEIEHAAPGRPGHLVGQVVPETAGLLPHAPHTPSQSGNIWLEEPGHDPKWALLDASGEFSLPAPHGRRWALWIDWGGWRVRVRGS